ncbi:MAG: glycosyltransferase, partial [Candidatus Omnitrophica bacterium]|nr:glycosyltransferase [Candidatus Omnitrophota bacterium]
MSIIIPCKNEKNNIETIIKRTPSFGASQEFIFVEGHSTDGTGAEINRVIRAYPDKTIKLFTQTNTGKNDAVYLGLAHSIGDIVIIFDSDLTIMPEDMIK